MKRGGDTRTFAARLATVEREREILTRRLKGESTSSIALALKLSQRACQLALTRALTRVDIPGAVAAKRAMLARLDLMREKLFKRLDTDPCLDAPTTVRALVAIETREAALLGLDPPQRMYLPPLDPRHESDAQWTEKLEKLDRDEVRQLWALTRKLQAPDTETTAMTVPEESRVSRDTPPFPPAPTFESDTSDTLSEVSASRVSRDTPLEPAIGESPREKRIRELEGEIARCLGDDLGQAHKVNLQRELYELRSRK